MNELNMRNSIKASEESKARPDFADLLRRIEADGGQSTALCTMRSNAGKYVGVAAGIVAVAAISVTALVGISGGMNYSSEAAAPMEPSAPAEAPDEEYMYSDSVGEENASNIADNEMQKADEEVISDGDVSDSDVSGSDAQEVD